MPLDSFRSIRSDWQPTDIAWLNRDAIYSAASKHRSKIMTIRSRFAIFGLIFVVGIHLVKADNYTVTNTS